MIRGVVKLIDTKNPIFPEISFDARSFVKLREMVINVPDRDSHRPGQLSPSGGGLWDRQGGPAQTENEVPQPHCAVAFGLRIWKAAPINSSTKSISEPARYISEI